MENGGDAGTRSAAQAASVSGVGKFEVVDTPSRLAEVLALLGPCEPGQPKVVGLDTEFAPKTAGGDAPTPTRLSLLQVQINDSCFLIDALAEGMTLDGVGPWLLRTDIIFVMHDCVGDVEVLHESTGVVPKNVFDTQIAASLVGFKRDPSLCHTVAEFLRVEFPKDKQTSRCDWTQRPLTPAQHRYAALDVQHLPRLAEVLRNVLFEKQRFAWAQQDSTAAVARVVERLNKSAGIAAATAAAAPSPEVDATTVAAADVRPAVVSTREALKEAIDAMGTTLLEELIAAVQQMSTQVGIDRARLATRKQLVQLRACLERSLFIEASSMQEAGWTDEKGQAALVGVTDSLASKSQWTQWRLELVLPALAPVLQHLRRLVLEKIGLQLPSAFPKAKVTVASSVPATAMPALAPAPAPSSPDVSAGTQFIRALGGNAPVAAAAAAAVAPQQQQQQRTLPPSSVLNIDARAFDPAVIMTKTASLPPVAAAATPATFDPAILSMLVGQPATAAAHADPAIVAQKPLQTAAVPDLTARKPIIPTPTALGTHASAAILDPAVISSLLAAPDASAPRSKDVLSSADSSPKRDENTDNILQNFVRSMSSDIAADATAAAATTTTTTTAAAAAADSKELPALHKLPEPVEATAGSGLSGLLDMFQQSTGVPPPTAGQPVLIGGEDISKAVEAAAAAVRFPAGREQQQPPVQPVQPLGRNGKPTPARQAEQQVAANGATAPAGAGPKKTYLSTAEEVVRCDEFVHSVMLHERRIAKTDLAYAFLGLDVALEEGAGGEPPRLVSISVQVKDMLYVFEGPAAIDLFPLFLEVVVRQKKRSEDAGQGPARLNIFFVTADYAKMHSDAVLTGLFGAFFNGSVKGEALRAALGGEYLFFTLFNTQIAAAFLGLGEAVGYTTLVEELIMKPKEESGRVVQRRADTGPSLLHLPKVAKKLVNRLRELGRLDVVLEECGVMDEGSCAVPAVLPLPPCPPLPYHCLLLSKFPVDILLAFQRSKKAVLTLRNLCIWRENVCRGRVLFPHVRGCLEGQGFQLTGMALPMRVAQRAHAQVLEDAHIVRIAQAVEESERRDRENPINSLIKIGGSGVPTVEELETAHGVPRELVSVFGATIVSVTRDAVQAASLTPEAVMTLVPHPNPQGVDYILQHLLYTLEQSPAHPGVPSSRMVNLYQLLDLIAAFESSLRSRTPMVLPQEWMGWRYPALVPLLLPVLEGDVAHLMDTEQLRFQEMAAAAAATTAAEQQQGGGSQERAEARSGVDGRTVSPPPAEPLLPPLKVDADDDEEEDGGSHNGGSGGADRGPPAAAATSFSYLHALRGAPVPDQHANPVQKVSAGGSVALPSS